jgi:hypothetical protein
MRFLLGAAVAASSFFAVPAFADGPPIVQFNGHSVTVSAGTAPGLDPKEAVEKKAQEACKSVGKTARLEEVIEIRSMRSHFFYVCL